MDTGANPRLERLYESTWFRSSSGGDWTAWHSFNSSRNFDSIAWDANSFECLSVGKEASHT